MMRKASRKRFEPIPVKTVFNTKVRVIHPESLTAIYSNYVEVVTGPQWLYQVECHLRTLLRHDRFRSGGSQPQGPMGTNLIVVSSPTFHEHLYLPECSKQFSIQQFIA